MTFYIHGDLFSSNLMRNAEYHLIEGRRWGFKECCIKNYVNLLKLGIAPAGFMHFVLGQDTYNVGHVLCPLCYAEYDKTNPNRPRNTQVFVDSRTQREVQPDDYAQYRI